MVHYGAVTEMEQRVLMDYWRQPPVMSPSTEWRARPTKWRRSPDMAAIVRVSDSHLMLKTFICCFACVFAPSRGREIFTPQM